MELHDQQFQEMVNEFFKSYHNWIPIVHEESFREHYNKQLLHTSRGLTALILGMCLLTRPFMDEGGEDTLRISLCTVLRRLFWVPTLVERPTMPLIQSSVLLSFYEYGQGMINSAYITICTCSGLAQVCSLNETQQSSLPGSGFWTPQIECERTWWAILIHERFVKPPTLITGYNSLQLNYLQNDQSENRRPPPSTSYQAIRRNRECPPQIETRRSALHSFLLRSESSNISRPGLESHTQSRFPVSRRTTPLPSSSPKSAALHQVSNPTKPRILLRGCRYRSEVSFQFVSS